MESPDAFSRRSFLVSGAHLALASTAQAALPAALHSAPSADSDRVRWLALLERVSEAPLSALSKRTLRRSMPVEAVAGHEADRAQVSPLEATGRLLAGLAPWLELPPGELQSPAELALQKKYLAWAQEAIVSAVDPQSPDYMLFGVQSQTLVDSSFLSLALLRAPRQLLGTLTSASRLHLVEALEKERRVQPPFSNWLLFAALNEAMLRALDSSWDRMRVDYAMRTLQTWYVGDGTYGDGPHYHADFYNSFVIHPYLLALTDALKDEPSWRPMAHGIAERAQRYAAIQERMISPGGEYPVLGRSIAYRAGAFHLLADAARRELLPAEVSAAAVRCALTAVQRRTLEPEGTFTNAGWLQVGVAGHQPELAETYISTGSLYLCSAVWLPLGLPPSHPFWSSPPEDWTQKRVWSGGKARADHAHDE